MSLSTESDQSSRDHPLQGLLHAQQAEQLTLQDFYAVFETMPYASTPETGPSSNLLRNRLAGGVRLLKCLSAFPPPYWIVIVIGQRVSAVDAHYCMENTHTTAMLCTRVSAIPRDPEEEKLEIYYPCLSLNRSTLVPLLRIFGEGARTFPCREGSLLCMAISPL